MAAKCVCPDCRMSFPAPRNGETTVTCPICDAQVPVPAAPAPPKPTPRKSGPGPAPVATAVESAPAAPSAPAYALPAAVALPAPPRSRRRKVLTVVGVLGVLYLVGMGIVAAVVVRGDRRTAAVDTKPAPTRPLPPKAVIQTLPSDYVPPEPPVNILWDRRLTEMRDKGFDLVLCFDSTGSMGNEIAEMKVNLPRFLKLLQEQVPTARISLCAYRDVGKEYVTKGMPLTGDIKNVEDYLSTLNAVGGGTASAVQEGLRWSMEKNEFRPGAVKRILLFGDAPPHAEQAEQCEQLARDFRIKQGGTVTAVSCLNKPMPEFLKIAQAGGGEATAVKDHRLIVPHLMILAFGSVYQEQVVAAFREKK